MLIRCVDLETTGLAAPEHTVCEIGWADLVLDGAAWRVSGGGSVMVNPGRPIPPETSAVHHIIDDDVDQAITWAEACPLVFDGNATAFAAHNAKFEQQWCTGEVVAGAPFICTFKAALRLWPQAPTHSNQGLRYWRRPDGIDRAIAAYAHRAYPDAYVTAHLLREMLADATVEDLIRWTTEPALQVRCGFGKHRGQPWAEVPADYLRWAERQDFDEDVLFTVRHELERRRSAA